MTDLETMKQMYDNADIPYTEGKEVIDFEDDTSESAEVIALYVGVETTGSDVVHAFEASTGKLLGVGVSV